MTEKNKYFLKAYNSLVFMKQPNIILSVCLVSAIFNIKALLSWIHGLRFLFISLLFFS